jgi:hypothetical protein
VERADALVEDGFGNGKKDTEAEDGPKQTRLDGTVGIVDGDGGTESENGERRTNEEDIRNPNVVEDLAEVDTANTTPIEALNILNRLSKKAEKTDRNR